MDSAGLLCYNPPNNGQGMPEMGENVMKRLIVPILVLAILLSACGASGQSIAAPAPSASSSEVASDLLDELEDETEAATSEVAQSTKAETLFHKEITFDGSNKILFLLTEKEGVQNGNAMLTFDGKNIELEATLMGMVMMAYNELGLENFMILVTSGESAPGTLMRSNGKSSIVTPLPEGYQEIITGDTGELIDTYAEKLLIFWEAIKDYDAKWMDYYHKMDQLVSINKALNG